MGASLSRNELEVLLEINDPDEWGQIVASWDTAVWDGDDPNDLWAPDEAGWVNVVCDMRGFVWEYGRQTVWDQMLAASFEIELDNKSGRYSVFGSESYPRIRPGISIKAAAIKDGVKYPIFVGDVEEYLEGQTPEDEKVTLRATDKSRVLADPIDVDYHAGTDNQLASDRVISLLDRIGFDGNRVISVGRATMTNYLTTRTILDEIQLTAVSDGAIFFFDKDGSATYLGRERIFGRPTGRPIPTFSDGCEDNGIPYAAVEPVLADHEFGNVVLISNVSQGTDSPKAAIAVDQESIDANGRYMWSPDQLVIANAASLQELANWHLERRSTAFYRINSFEVYPVHDERAWAALLPMRIGDPLFVVRTPPESATLSAAMICDGMRIEATPELWKFTIRCTPGDQIPLADFWSFDYWNDATWAGVPGREGLRWA